MDFLDKLFGKKQKETKKEHVILEFREIPEFSRKIYFDSFNEIEKEVFSGISEIKHFLNSLKSSLNSLEEQKVEQDKGHKKLRKIAATSKKTFIDKMRNLISKLSPPSKSDFIELNSYFENSIQILESEINSFGKNIAYTGIVLKDSVQDVGKKIRELNSSFRETKKLFDSKKELNLFPEITSLFHQTEENIAQKKTSVSAEKEVMQKIYSAEEELTKTKKKLAETKNSIEAKQYDELLKQKSSLMEEKQKLKISLVELFYPVEKLLRGFRKLVESKHFVLNEDERILLNNYLSNPVLALKKDSRAETLKKIFNYIKELAEEGKISLKPKEKEKRMNALNELLEFDFFEKFFWKLNELDKNLNEIQSRINSLDVSSKIFSLENRLESLEHSIKNYSNELEKQKNKTKEISNKISSFKNSLEEKISIFSGKEIEIKH